MVGPVGDDFQKLLGSDKPELGKISSAVCWRMKRWSARCSIRQLCCPTVLVGTNPMLGLVTASQIASASVASFFCRLSRVEERRGVALISTPFPLPAHQTGRAVFPHPAFRQRCV